MKKTFGFNMILRRFRSTCLDQSGYTLIEILATIVISSIISLGALMANGQIITQTVKNNDFTTANRHVLNAIQWISRDTQMAQTIEGYSGFPTTSNLTLSWMTWDNQYSQVVYSIENGDLRRSYTAGDNPTQHTLISQYINTDPGSTFCSWNNQELILTITGSVGQGIRTINVKK
jgi:prepilin-type N-terminal cleavage/methylation domain-containing protein